MPISILLLSALEASYATEPNPWGYMLSNAKDFIEGRIPYKEIFIQYGFLTTLVHAFAFKVGGTLISIQTITAIFYALGLIPLFYLARLVLNSELLARYVFVTLFLLHPIIIYPWSNYIAFPFITLGTLMLLYGEHQSRYLVFGGISLGLASIAREGLTLPITLMIIGYPVLQIRSKGLSFSKAFKKLILLLVGISIPIGLFFLYLLSNDLFHFWSISAFEVPKIYLNDVFPHMKGFIFKDLFYKFWKEAVLHIDIRWLVVFTMLGATFFLFLKEFFDKSEDFGLLFVSYSALLLLSSSLHIAELFRIATASSIGLISLYALLKRNNISHRYFKVVAIWMSITFIFANRSNYFLPGVDDIIKGRTVSIPVFSGQIWKPEISDFYKSVNQKLIAISESKCGIRYLRNIGPDLFVVVLSPFPLLQYVPYDDKYIGDGLRSDIKLIWDKKLKEAKEIVIMRMVNASEPLPLIPDGYKLIDKIPAPRIYRRAENLVLLIEIPIQCSLSYQPKN